MARKSYRIGPHSYPTKKAAQEAIREVLYRHPIGATLQEPDRSFIAALVEQHPEAELKIGVGVASLQVEQNGPTRGFWLTRVDGTRTDFSFVSCLTPPTPESDALAGLRFAIRDQVAAFRNTLPQASWACPVSGDLISLADCHIDHEVPFLDLVTGFLAHHGLVLGSLAVNHTEDGSTDTRLVDANVVAAWQAYHREHARLRAVSRRANLSLLRRRPR